ncbi:MAG: T9SS type A sorting domain-containing protein [Crocinitomix sp.]|nr:T9SS type A sorting domain-containing protein [Crocinitomix sp.]
MRSIKLIFNIFIISYICCFQLNVHAQDTFYFIDSEGDLYSKDGIHCDATFIGPTDNVLVTIVDLAFDFDADILYGVSLSGHLLEINIETGFTSYAVPWYIPSISSLEYKDGKLYFDGKEDATDTHSLLHSYDTSTGDIVVYGAFSGHTGAGDLAFCGDDLYFTTLTNHLVKVNIDNPSESIDLGNTGLLQQWGLMAFEFDCTFQLYITSNNDLYRINTETLDTELICTDFTEFLIYGMTARRDVSSTIEDLAFSHSMNQEIITMPNPVFDYAKLKLPFSNGKLEFLTINGQSVLTESVFDYQLTLDLSALPSGTYIIRQTHDAGVTLGKLIKL